MTLLPAAEREATAPAPTREGRGAWLGPLADWRLCAFSALALAILWGGSFAAVQYRLDFPHHHPWLAALLHRLNLFPAALLLCEPLVLAGRKCTDANVPFIHQAEAIWQTATHSPAGHD